MKKMILLLISLCGLIVLSGCKTTEMTSVPSGFVPSRELALEVGKIYLNRVYGEEKVAEHEPFEANLNNDQWVIDGKSNPYIEHMRIILQRSTGKVVSVTPVIDYSKPQRR